jgi:hypothetical protein
MKQVYRSAGLSCIVALVALGCSKKTEPANEASATSASGAPASGSPAPAGAFTSKVAASCKLPEPAPKKLGAPDPAYAAMFDAVAKAEPEQFGRSEAGDKLVNKAKESVPDSNEAPAGVIAACVAGLDHASAPARRVAADCLLELGYSMKDTAPVVLRLLEKIEATRDDSERLSYSSAVAKMDTVGAGYTCRVLRLIAKLPSKEPATAELVGSLHSVGSSPTNNESFDFAYELIMANREGVTAARAMEMLTVFAPEARKGEVCERLGAILKAGVDGWGSASTAVWKDETCKQRDAVVANAVTKLKWLESPTNFKDIDRPLLNANYIDDLPTWPGLSATQKKSVCDAAKSLEAHGKLDDVKSLGKKIAAACAK